MKPFIERGSHSSSSTPISGSQRRSPKKTGYGVEIRRGRDIANRKTAIFISSGRWAEMADDGVIDQQITQLVFGELIDPLEMVPFSDQTERVDPAGVLSSGEIIRGQTLDYEGEANKDGRITVFDIRPRGYVTNEEIPHKTRGIKVDNVTILGYSVGYSYNPFFDGGASVLGISREGYYGIPEEVMNTFEDVSQKNGLGFDVDFEDYNENYQQGSHGNILYSSKFGTDSIAFYGLLK